MYLLQIIALVIYATIMICAFLDFRRTIITWVPLSLLFNSQVCVSYSESAVALTVAVNISLVVMYFTIKKREVRNKGNNESFGLKPFMTFMIISLFISSLFSVIPFASSVNKLVKSTVMGYGMLFVFFRCLNSMDDIKLFIKVSIVVTLLITIDGIIENFTHVNFAGDFIYSSSPHDEFLLGRSWYVPSYLTGGFKSRFGITRCYSFFSLHIHFGVACAFMLYLFINIVKNQWKIFRASRLQKNLVLICIILAASGVIFSNSKTPMLGVCVLLLAYYNLKQLFNYKMMLPLVVAIVLIVTYMPDYINNFLSLADEELAEEGGGSTIATRQEQFNLILRLFAENPIWGNGINAASYFSKNVSGFEGILGAESRWFKLLADQGLVGCIAYMYMYFNCYKFSKNIIPKRMLSFFLVGVLLMETTTGSINFLLWAPIMLVIRRYYQLK